jgi:virginiamycin A acetyltransferase
MKNALKSVLYGIAVTLALPLWLLYRLQSLVAGRPTAFYDFSQLLSLFPGTPGNYLRYGFYKLTLARLGRDACICFGATISHPGTEIGRGAYVGPYANLGLCAIGDDVLIGTGVHVMSGFTQHGTEDLERPMREQPGKLVRVSIGEDCWIGNRSVVGADVGRKTIVGAASVVTKELPAMSIAVGNPARVLRSRLPGAETQIPRPEN